MKNKELLENLEKTFEGIGINVKYEKIEGEGGFCRYNEKEFVILNRMLPLVSRVDILKNILKERMKTHEFYIMPVLREIIEEKNEDN